MYATTISNENDEETQQFVYDIPHEKKRKHFSETDIENYLMELHNDQRAVKNGKKDEPTDSDRNLIEKTQQHSIVRILERRYPLTVTGYKYLNIGINVKLPSYVDIIIGDSHGKEISILPETWRELLEQKRTILSHLQQYNESKGTQIPSQIFIGNLTLRFGRINNLPILRLETSIARLSMSKSTVLYMFNLEHCVNRLIHSLTAITDNVDRKFSRLLDIASNVTESVNMLKAMYDNDSFDRNDIVECELIALVFGEH